MSDAQVPVTTGLPLVGCNGDLPGRFLRNDRRLFANKLRLLSSLQLPIDHVVCLARAMNRLVVMYVHLVQAGDSRITFAIVVVSKNLGSRH